MNATGNIYKPQNEDPSDDSSVENRSQRSVSHTPFSRLQNLTIHSFPEPVQLERITAPRRSRSRSQVAAEKGRRRLLADYYADLFNESLDEISHGICYDDTYHSLPSQVGVVSWTVEEKDVFFKALSRYGKGATPRIASTIGTKCELEVRALTELLEKRLSYRLIREPRSRLLTLADIPAAYEISDECCRALEECADALLAEERDKEKQVYRRKDRDYWLVDYSVAASVEEVMRDNSSDSDKHEDENIENNNLPKKISSESHGENENRPEESNDNNGEGHTGGDTATKDTNSVKGQAESSIFTTAKLLHISNWVRLSERIFMNAGQKSPENNWTRIAGEDESPSLTSDSFAGFYALAISITRRLVQSSIFFALSRIRSVRQVGYGVQDVLRKEDVTAALDVLKMKRNSHDFWAQAARRCKLDVQDIRHIKGWKPVPLSYNVIEDQLSGDSPLPDEMNEAGVSELDVATIDTVHESGDNLEESSSDNLEPTHKSPSLADGSFDQLSDPEEAEAEDVDKNASSVEERQLWIEIKRQPSHLPSVLDEPQVRAKAGDNEQRHTLSRKTKQDIVDWRGRLLYHSEWEQFGPQTPLVEREILENRRKRRRLG